MVSGGGTELKGTRELKGKEEEVEFISAGPQSQKIHLYTCDP